MSKFISHCPMYPDGFIRIKPGTSSFRGMYNVQRAQEHNMKI